MLRTILARLRQGYRTARFPYETPNLPERFRGALRKAPENCARCNACASVCPTAALAKHAASVDLSKCLFCGRCSEVCPSHALSFSKEYRLGALSREALCYDTEKPFTPDASSHPVASKRFKKSLKIRQISAGGCNACELDFNVLHTLAWDMGRFGIAAVASPRHADAVLVTGPISKNMVVALKKTIAAMPNPCCVIACGACALSGGLYAEHEECSQGLDKILPVDLYIPGCPPHPATVLDALLRLMHHRTVS